MKYDTSRDKSSKPYLTAWVEMKMNAINNDLICIVWGFNPEMRYASRLNSSRTFLIMWVNLFIYSETSLPEVLVTPDLRGIIDE